MSEIAHPPYTLSGAILCLFHHLHVQTLSGGWRAERCSLPPIWPPFPLLSLWKKDASLVGWGAYLHSSAYTQGRWSSAESRLHINYLELKAIFLGVQALFPGSSHLSLLVRSDNISAVSYIYHKGGTKSWHLCKLALELWDYCISLNIRLGCLLPWCR